MRTASTSSSKRRKRPLQPSSSPAQNSSKNDLCGICHKPLKNTPFCETIDNAVNGSKRRNSNRENMNIASAGAGNSTGATSYEGNEPQRKGVPRQVSMNDSHLSNSARDGISGAVTSPGNQIGDSHANAIVSCANMLPRDESLHCKSASSDHESPYFHFSCVQKQLPENSKLYWDLCQFLDQQEEEKRRKRMRALARELAKMENAKNMGNKLGGNLVINAHANNNDAIKTNGDNGLNLPDEITIDAHDISSRISINSPAFIDNKNHPTPAVCSSSGRSTPSASSFHSNSINIRKAQNIKNPFLCHLCDLRGSTTFLAEYFSNFRATKADFYQDDEAIDAIMSTGEFQPGHSDERNGDNMPTHQNTYNNSNGLSKEGSMTMDRGFIKFLLSQQQVIEGSSYKHTELTLKHIQNILQSIPRNNREDDKHMKTPVFDFGKIQASHLIGQPIRLFCDVSNSYHTGRIIDSRKVSEIDTQRLKKETKKTYMRHDAFISASNGYGDGVKEGVGHNIMLDSDIGRTQYLLRFRARVGGRKVAMQQWIYLEEHAVMVGVQIVWANVSFGHENKSTEELQVSMNKTSACEKGNLSADIGELGTLKEQKRKAKRLKSKFRPVQIFVRSALEMAHVDNIMYSKGANDINGGNTDMLNMVANEFKSDFKCFSVKIENCARKKKSALCTRIPASDVASTAASTISLPKEKIDIKSRPKEASTFKNPRSRDEAKNNDDHAIREELSILESAFSDLILADFHSPPDELMRYLKVLRVYDETLVHATTCACIEEEEQRRLLCWQG